MSALARTPTGDVATPLRVQRDPGQLTAWKLADQFNFWLGEWFLDVTQGFPWVQRVLSLKQVTIPQVRALLQQSILEAPLVASIKTMNVTVDRQAKALACDFVAKLVDGTEVVVSGGTGQPFVVTGAPQ